MKFMIQHLKYGSYFWISHFEDIVQKLVVIQRSSNQKTPTDSPLMKEVG